MNDGVKQIHWHNMSVTIFPVSDFWNIFANYHAPSHISVSPLVYSSFTSYLEMCIMTGRLINLLFIIYVLALWLICVCCWYFFLIDYYARFCCNWWCCCLLEVTLDLIFPAPLPLQDVSSCFLFSFIFFFSSGCRAFLFILFNPWIYKFVFC